MGRRSEAALSLRPDEPAPPQNGGQFMRRNSAGVIGNEDNLSLAIVPPSPGSGGGGGTQQAEQTQGAVSHTAGRKSASVTAAMEEDIVVKLRPVGM